ncbi:MAG: hypothetical protein JNM85_05020 [Chthonomonas sp.]|nr:hypothetical protein [Chthonomonas sp.]
MPNRTQPELPSDRRLIDQYSRLTLALLAAVQSDRLDEMSPLLSERETVLAELETLISLSPLAIRELNAAVEMDDRLKVALKAAQTDNVKGLVGHYEDMRGRKAYAPKQQELETLEQAG